MTKKSVGRHDSIDINRHLSDVNGPRKKYNFGLSKPRLISIQTETEIDWKSE